jgi:hypothetical protein
MKRLCLLGFVGLLAGWLAGCPIFSDNDHGGTQTCTGPGCSSGCHAPSDCLQNETCGTDNACHPGDCTSTSCVAGYVCSVDPNTQTASCVPNGGTGGMNTGGSTTTSTTTTSSTSTTSSTTTSTTAPVYCGHPADCGTGQFCAGDGTCHAGSCSATDACIFGYTCNSGTCQGVPNACDKDSDCSGGSLCIAGSDGKGGLCTTVPNQCFDQSQCSTGEKCVAGKCTLGCTGDSDCRDGFKCDTAHGGVCTIPAKACTITNDCGSAMLVCVGGACVPRSNGGTCSNPGDVWTENGCIPNQGATFTCQQDGVQDACTAGSICLHHDCWISCDATTMVPCTSQTILNTCKPVVSNGTSYNVCGTSQNLGSECGAGSIGNKMCTGGKVCIDGFCK